MANRLREGFRFSDPEKCMVSKCMSLLGGAWTPALIWNLSKGARRFNELKYFLAPISSKMLSKRLLELSTKGVVLRIVSDTRPPSVEYELTDLGLALLPIIQKMAEVGANLEF